MSELLQIFRLGEVEAVHALCDQIEANYPTPELQAKLEDFRRFVAEKFAQQAGRHPPGSIR